MRALLTNGCYIGGGRLHRLNNKLLLVGSGNTIPIIKATTTVRYRAFTSSSSSSSSGDDGNNPKYPSTISGKFTKHVATIIRKSGIVDDEDLIHIMAKTTTVASFSLMAIAGLGTMGIDTKPFIAGIVVTGFAAGFALKEIATNYLSGVLLVFSKPFTKGQYIKVMSGSGLEGVVESVDIRHVVLKTKDSGLLMIPSSVVYSNPILILPKQ